MKYTTILSFTIVLVIGVRTANIDAQIIDTVGIHGFGGWAYGKTDNKNRYLVGNEDGNYDNVNFSLNIGASPYEKLSIHVQTGYTESLDEDNVGLDYAFAEWWFSDALNFRAGKVKAPFMFSTEVYDVGTIRPFFTLPGVYHQLTAEAYKGAGIMGALYTKHGWELHYDVYGGKLSLLPFTDHWQVAAHYEFADFDIDAPEFQFLPESSYKHQEIAVGIKAESKSGV